MENVHIFTNSCGFQGSLNSAADAIFKGLYFVEYIWCNTTIQSETIQLTRKIQCLCRQNSCCKTGKYSTKSQMGQNWCRLIQNCVICKEGIDIVFTQLYLCQNIKTISVVIINRTIFKSDY